MLKLLTPLFRMQPGRVWLSLLVALVALQVSPARAATSVYHSPNDDGLPGSTVPEGGVQSVYLYIDGGALASGAGMACNTGTGDEVCGYTIELNGITGLTLSTFTPDVGANLMVNFSASTIRVNGLDTQAPVPGPHRIGELFVNANAGGAVELTSGEVVGASLASETLVTSTVVTVPEPGLHLLLPCGSLLLLRMQRRRAGR